MNSLFQRFHCTAVLLAVAPVLFAQRVSAQNPSFVQSTSTAVSLPSAPQQAVSRHHVETSVSLGAIAQLAATRVVYTSTNQTTESLSPSEGVLASFGQSFRPWLGYSVNFGYTTATYRYLVTAPAYPTLGSGYVPTNMYETSISYIAQKHLTHRVTVFGEAGGGAIGYAAINRASADFALLRRSNTFQPAGITGFGMEYRLAHGLGLRAEYRGLFVKYPYPDYSDSLRLNTLLSEPALSVTYHFGTRFKH